MSGRVIVITGASGGIGADACGGIFSPTLFLGAMTGLAVAGFANTWLPLTHADFVILAAVGMSACFGAVVRAPLTALLIVFEMKATHPGLQVSLVMPGMVATDFSRNALGGTPPPSAGRNMQVQTAEEVAAMIATLIEHPQPELYTNSASAPLARRYFEDVAAFESTMRP